jgi:xylan 1,4-beta-xylosidase
MKIPLHHLSIERFCLIAVSFFLIITIAPPAFSQTKSSDQKATITVDLKKETGDMYPMWAWFGHDEPNYTYMKDGKKLLSELAALSPAPVFMRVHNLLTSGDGTPALKWGSTNAYTEDAAGNPIYNWRIVDSIFDTYIKRGMKPFAQIGFMPEALSIKPQPYKHEWQPGKPYNLVYTGWTYPPKDYDKWRELVYQWVKHCVEKYGKKEVESWYWEVWNEPNIGYWKGTRQEFFKLYDYAADGLKTALPTAKIGGPEIAGASGRESASFLNEFIKHCLSDTNYATGKIGSPIDLISFHAKGSPRVVSGHVRMNMAPQLRDIAAGFKTVSSYPQIKNLPIVIGESDPEGCAACGMATNPENAYRNGTMYSSYTAASFARKYLLADSIGINFLGAVSWSFEFENQPWFYGFRDLATNGVDKPVLNVFRMYGMMKGRRVAVEGSSMYATKEVLDSSVRKANTDIGGLAAKDKRAATVMIWNYHDDDVQGPPAMVEVTINGVSAKQVTLTQYRIDSEHSNSYEVWKGMESPQNPTAAQIATLEKAGQLKTLNKPEKLKSDKGRLVITASLPRQGVTLLKMEW